MAVSHRARAWSGCQFRHAPERRFEHPFVQRACAETTRARTRETRGIDAYCSVSESMLTNIRADSDQSTTFPAYQKKTRPSNLRKDGRHGHYHLRMYREQESRLVR